MLERAPHAACYLCGAPPGPWNEPALAAHPSAAAGQLRALEERVRDLEQGRTSAMELYHHLLAMCSMCQEVVADVGQGTAERDVLARLRFRIDRLRKQAAASP